MILKRGDWKHFPDYDTIMANIRTIFFGCYPFAYNIQVKTLFKKCWMKGKKKMQLLGQNQLFSQLLQLRGHPVYKQLIHTSKKEKIKLIKKKKKNSGNIK